jgi:hypothetical protein
VNALPAFFATGFLAETQIAAIITAKLARKTVLARMFFQTCGSYFGSIGSIYLSLNTGNGNKGHGDSPKPFVLFCGSQKFSHEGTKKEHAKSTNAIVPDEISTAGRQSSG